MRLTLGPGVGAEVGSQRRLAHTDGPDVEVMHCQHPRNGAQVLPHLGEEEGGSVGMCVWVCVRSEELV